MTAPGELDLAAVMAALAALPAQLTGREGQAIRERVERLAGILGAQGPDAELRSRAAAELEQLIAAVGELAAGAKGRKRAAQAPGAIASPGARSTPGGSAESIASPGSAGARSTPGGSAESIDLGQLADGLRTFVEFLRAPTAANQAQVEQMVATLEGAAVPRPVPLDQLNIDATVEQLAVESARRHGLQGAEARHAIARMKREMQMLVRQLELRAHQEASRATTAAEMERLFDAVVNTGTPLGQALAPERAAIIAAYRSVDLAHMAEGLRVFGEWLAKPSRDPAAHVAELRSRLSETLGPATAGDPGRSEAERRADFEREIQVAVDEIFRGSGLGRGPGGAGAP